MNLEEEYIHYQEAITSLNRAWRTLRELEKSPARNAAWSAAYRMAIVEYCKPFTVSQISKKERYKLPLPSVTDESKIIHDRLLELRNKFMAHSDLTALDAKIYYDKTAEYPTPLISKNILSDFPSVTEIKTQVETVLDALYQRESQYELRFKRQS
jgi:hypothetical protein